MRKSLYVFFLSFFLFCSVCYSQVPSYVPTSGLVGFWGFNGNANDISGNNNHGTTTSVTLASDRFGNINSAYQFNGSTSRIETSNAFFNNGWTNYTVSFWANSSSFLNPNNYNDAQIAINTIPHNGIDILFYGSNNPFTTAFNNKYVVLAGSNPSNGTWNVLPYNAISNSNRTINTWNHIVLVKEGLSFKFYLNGVLDRTINGSTTPISYMCRIVFGNISPEISSNEGFLGKLDDYAIWNRNLSQSEISSLYTANCNAELTLTSPTDDLSTGTIEKTAVAINGRIIANNKISGTANVTYKAKAFIDLIAGFQANSGTVFSGNIVTVGCQ
jgi:hypothetical protein